jgi:hypothetical protein
MSYCFSLKDFPPLAEQYFGLRDAADAPVSYPGNGKVMKGRYTGILFQLLAVMAFLFGGCRTTFAVEPDRTDFISYSFGGGEVGADFGEIKIRGDGAVTYRYTYPEPRREELTRETALSPAETKKIMQGLIDAGLFDLKSERLGGADLDWAKVRAQMDGREVGADFAGRFDGLKEVRELILPLIKDLHPGLWKR